MSTIISTPDAALRRAAELTAEGNEDEAISVLLKVFSLNKAKLRVDVSLEKVALMLSELCVKNRDFVPLNEALHKFRALCTRDVPQYESLKKVFVGTQRVAEDALNKAISETGLESGISAVDTVNTDHLFLRAVCDHSSEFDKLEIFYIRRFLWELYRKLMELLRATINMEGTYHFIVTSAAKFCVDHKRTQEFRRLVDTTKVHHTIMLKNYAKAPLEKRSNLEMIVDPYIHIPTRIRLLKSAISIELWKEAAALCEDITQLGIYQIYSKYRSYTDSNIKSENDTKIQYMDKHELVQWILDLYESIGEITWKIENHVFHAVSRFKYLQNLKRKMGDKACSSVKSAASISILSLLCVPLLYFDVGFEKRIPSGYSGRFSSGSDNSSAQTLTKSGSYSQNKYKYSPDGKKRAQYNQLASNISLQKCNLIDNNGNWNNTAAIFPTSTISTLLDEPDQNAASNFLHVVNGLASEKLIEQAHEPVLKLYALLSPTCFNETNRDNIGDDIPLDICSYTIKYLDEIENDKNMSPLHRYIFPLKKKIIQLVLSKASTVFTSLSFDYFIKNLCPNEFLPWTHVEHIMVQTAKERDSKLEIDSKSQFIFLDSTPLQYGIVPDPRSNTQMHDSILNKSNMYSNVRGNCSLCNSHLKNVLRNTANYFQKVLKLLCRRRFYRKWQERTFDLLTLCKSPTNIYDVAVRKNYLLSGTENNNLCRKPLTGDSDLSAPNTFGIRNTKEASFIPYFLCRIAACSKQQLWHCIFYPTKILLEYSNREVEKCGTSIEVYKEKLRDLSMQNSLQRSNKQMEKDQADVERKKTEIETRRNEEKIAKMKKEESEKNRQEEMNIKELKRHRLEKAKKYIEELILFEEQLIASTAPSAAGSLAPKADDNLYDSNTSDYKSLLASYNALSNYLVSQTASFTINGKKVTKLKASDLVEKKITLADVEDAFSQFASSYAKELTKARKNEMRRNTNMARIYSILQNGEADNAFEVQQEAYAEFENIEKDKKMKYDKLMEFSEEDISHCKYDVVNFVFERIHY